jgi:hypothetical protein
VVNRRNAAKEAVVIAGLVPAISMRSAQRVNGSGSSGLAAPLDPMMTAVRSREAA